MQQNKRSRPALLRAGVTYSDKLSVKPEDGRYGAGLITGVSVITAGAVPDRGVHIDPEFLESVAAAINKGKVKSRFGHPSLLHDVLGTTIGTFAVARVIGGHVRADLHILKTAHTTPRGDLAEYVLGLASEASDCFGASIVYESDVAAEDAFIVKHSVGGFQSPDTANPDNFPHARLKRLIAIDLVDEPSSNPAGLFAAPAASSTKASSAPASKVIGTAPAKVSTSTRARRRIKRVAKVAPVTFTQAANEYAKRHGITLGEALSYIARTMPELYAAHIQTAQELAALRAEKQLRASQTECRRRLQAPVKTTSRRASR